MVAPNESIATTVKITRLVVNGSLFRTKEDETKEEGYALVEVDKLNARSSMEKVIDIQQLARRELFYQIKKMLKKIIAIMRTR